MADIRPLGPLGLLSTFPPDLITRILHHSLSSAVREDFESLDINGTSGMVRATDRLSNPADRGKVKRVTLQLSSSRGKGKGRKFVDLMQGLTNLVELEFAVSEKNLEVLERWLEGGLGKLAAMRHLKIGPRQGRPLPHLNSAVLGKLAPRWKELRTITLQLYIGWPSEGVPNPHGLFHSLQHLTHLDFTTTDNDCDVLLNNPPSSLRHLTLSHPNLYVQDTLPSSVYNSLLAVVTTADEDVKLEIRHIRTFVLQDPPERGLPQAPVETRGRFHDLLEGMVDLRRLTCGPSAVKRLAWLGREEHLRSLREVVLVEDRARLTPPVGWREVLDLVGTGKPRRVSVGASIVANFSGAEQQAVEAKARAKGVLPKWL